MRDCDPVTDAFRHFAAMFAEHHGVDAIQVVATSHDPDTGKTSIRSIGVGNVFARLKAVESWLDDQDDDAADAYEPE